MDPKQQMLNLCEAQGAALAERWSKMPGNLIRGYSSHKKVDFLSGIPVEERRKRAVLATLYENALKWMQGLEETTRMLQVGSFEKFVFPIIRAVYANLVAAELVTVQPLTAPTGLVFFFDVLYGTTMGNINAGTRMFDARRGPTANFHYSDEVVQQEPIATGTGAVATYAGNVGHIPVRAGTVRFTDGTQLISDDGNGALVGNIGAGVNTVNYATGAYNLTFAANVANGTAITVDYEYDMEANVDIPQVDLVLTSSPVTAREQKLRARWSVESQQDLKAYHGIDAEVELVGFMANEIAKELNYKIVRHIAQIAAAGAVAWSRTPPAGVPWIWHKESFYDTLIQCSNLVFAATQRRNANWIVAGIQVCDVIETLQKFDAAGGIYTDDSAGVRMIGKIGGFTVYKDPTYPTTQFLMGYKGSSFLDTGYIMAPYQGLYTTPTIVLDDFISRKGLAQRTGLKVVNSRYYATGAVTP